MKHFEPQPGLPNLVLRLPGIFLSYNARPCRGRGFFESDLKQAETAMEIRGVWFILNGDHRKVYEQAANSENPLIELMEAYRRLQPEYGSSWSTDSTSDIYSFLQARSLSS